MKCLCGEELKDEIQYLKHICACDKIEKNLLRVLLENFQWLTERNIHISDVQHIIEAFTGGIFYTGTDDISRKAKIDGIVPVNCMLKGKMLKILITAKKDPCKFCYYYREICGGRPMEVPVLGI